MPVFIQSKMYSSVYTLCLFHWSVFCIGGCCNLNRFEMIMAVEYLQHVSAIVSAISGSRNFSEEERYPTQY